VAYPFSGVAYPFSGVAYPFSGVAHPFSGVAYLPVAYLECGLPGADLEFGAPKSIKIHIAQ